MNRIVLRNEMKSSVISPTIRTRVFGSRVITFDRIVLYGILAKEFLLDFLGFSTFSNFIVCALIVFLLINPKWKIPYFVYCAIAVMPFIVLSIPLANGDLAIGLVNLLRIIQVALYGLFFLYEYRTMPSFGNWLTCSARTFFSIVLYINIAVMLIQYAYPGFLVAASDAIVVSREDMISGLFGYGSTHAIALYSVFVILLNLDAAKSNKKYYFIALAIAVVSLGVATLNDNKALFFFMPIAVLLRYLIFFRFNYKRSTVKIVLLLPFVIVGVISLIILIPGLSTFFNNHIVNSIEIALRAFIENSYVNGSDERFKMISVALSLPGTWSFGDGIGLVDFYKEGYRGFNHFGLSDFGSITILCGMWFFLLVSSFFTLCFLPDRFSNLPNQRVVKHGVSFLALVLFLLFLFIAIYTQPFTQVRIAIPSFLLAAELSQYWSICFREDVSLEQR